MLRDTCTSLLIIALLGTAGFGNVLSAPVNANPAEIARRLVHEAKWAPTGTISTNTAIDGYPMVNTITIDDSDSTGKGTGIIYFMLAARDYTSLDWKATNKITMLFTDALNLKCGTASPMGHMCPRAYISGQVEKVDKESAEHRISLEAFHTRHPDSAHWPNNEDHGFYLAKLNINHIAVFGPRGPTEVSVDDYIKSTAIDSA